MVLTAIVCERPRHGASRLGRSTSAGAWSHRVIDRAAGVACVACLVVDNVANCTLNAQGLVLAQGYKQAVGYLHIAGGVCQNCVEDGCSRSGISFCALQRAEM